MDPKGYQWILMDLDGSRWILRDPHGILVDPIDPDKSGGVRMDPNGPC